MPYFSANCQIYNVYIKKYSNWRNKLKLEFHHINLVTENVDKLHSFYTEILGLNNIPIDFFPRPKATLKSGYDGKIKFATEGKIQMHIAMRDRSVAEVNGQKINPVEQGHMAFRTDDIGAVMEILDKNGICYSDYGTTFAKEWHQIFFNDPDGNVVEVHQQILK